MIMIKLAGARRYKGWPPTGWWAFLMGLQQSERP